MNIFSQDCKMGDFLSIRELDKGFPDGSMVKNSPANAEDTSLISELGLSHMLQRI